jgi:hypothetical protein
MNSRMNEDLAWLRVQDMQREAENRRLVAGSPSSAAMSAARRLIVQILTNVRSREAGKQSAARPTIEARRHV